MIKNIQTNPDLPAKAGRGALHPDLPSGKSRPKRGNAFARFVTEPPPEKERHFSPKSSGDKPPMKNYVPVSFVAKDWNITPRRIRSLLTEGRLTGRRLENGYWEVAYPYRYIIGTRGPVLKRLQPPKRGRPKSVGMAE